MGTGEKVSSAENLSQDSVIKIIKAYHEAREELQIGTAIKFYSAFIKANPKLAEPEGTEFVKDLIDEILEEQDPIEGKEGLKALSVAIANKDISAVEIRKIFDEVKEKLLETIERVEKHNKERSKPGGDEVLELDAFEGYELSILIVLCEKQPDWAFELAPFGIEGAEIAITRAIQLLNKAKPKSKAKGPAGPT